MSQRQTAPCRSVKWLPVSPGESATGGVIIIAVWTKSERPLQAPPRQAKP